MTDRPVEGLREAAADADTLLLAAGFTAGDVAALRNRVRQHADQAGLSGEQIDGFLIGVNEAMTNAVRHGGGTGNVRLWRNGDLVCEVHDDGCGFAADEYVQRVVRPQATPVGGVGLWLAREMTESLRITSGPDGTTVRIGARLPDNETDGITSAAVQEN